MPNIASSPAPLNIHPVDANSPIPLYHQVEIDLKMLIQSGALAPDYLLPPETELATLYGVGRQTVRMALSRLVNSGMIARQAGRGTFILPQADRKNFYLDQSFTRQMIEMGMTTHAVVLHASLGVIGQSAPKVLRQYHGAPCYNLARLRYGNDEPIGLQYSTIRTERCLGIETHDFARESLYDVLARRFQLAITRIRHTVTALTADDTQAELLDMLVGDTLLQVNTTAYLEDDDVIEANISYYRTDKYEFSTTHTL
jgi:GntR family transcriptional regulator